MAASTFASRTPRATICVSTIRARAAAVASSRTDTFGASSGFRPQPGAASPARSKSTAARGAGIRKLENEGARTTESYPTRL